MKILIIGAGIFGISTALKLSETHDVTLVDKNKGIMENASKCNHNRLHFGYHYPRSIETAEQSLEGYESFHENFEDAIVSDFNNYYMIENDSKVSSKEYVDFCEKLNIKCEVEYPKIDMDYSNIESSFLTNEPVFDYDIIKQILLTRLKKSNINLVFSKNIKNIKDIKNYDTVINTTYFNMNKINKIFNIEPIKLKFQTVIIPIFEHKSDKIGITIMDGDFCSIMPKGANDNTYLLYHVVYSVIHRFEGYVIPTIWLLGKKIIENKVIKKFIYDKYIVKRKIDKIFNNSKKYYTFLKDIKYIEYWQTIRALPINNDDCRLSTLTINDVDNVKVISVLSGKITTCCDVANKINNLLK